MMQHFLKETDFPKEKLPRLFALARQLKERRRRFDFSHAPLAGRTWLLLFHKNSTRTRVSFEAGVSELGARAIFLQEESMQMKRGETIADTAKTLSRYAHGLIIRTHGHGVVEEFAREGSVPVINALTDFLHPCQTYSDAFTLAETWSSGNPEPAALKGRKLAFLGDCAGNMANSWILGAHLFGMDIALAGPEAYAPGKAVTALLEREGFTPRYHFTADPLEAVRRADAVYTDVWVSMGMEEESACRLEAMKPYQVTVPLIESAAPGAVFMHCLPAHPGQEAAREALDHPRSVVFEQAENRLHMQKALLCMLSQSPAE